jgi:hypothetical protein
MVGSIYGRSSIKSAHFGKAALEINEQETRIAYDSHVCKWIKTE